MAQKEPFPVGRYAVAGTAVLAYLALLASVLFFAMSGEFDQLKMRWSVESPATFLLGHPIVIIKFVAVGLGAVLVKPLATQIRVWLHMTPCPSCSRWALTHRVTTCENLRAVSYFSCQECGARYRQVRGKKIEDASASIYNARFGM